MFSHIKTSKENKEVVTQLTNKLNLGAENVIARIALAHSLAQEEKLDLTNLKDSGGKEYSSKVLFGDYIDYYAGMVALHYGIHISDKDLGKYVKMHIDDGLSLLNKELASNSNIDGFDFLIEKIESSLSLLS
jgi:DNA sulfur modification protein DndE